MGSITDPGFIPENMVRAFSTLKSLIYDSTETSNILPNTRQTNENLHEMQK
jgi:hypothetical protein